MKKKILLVLAIFIVGIFLGIRFNKITSLNNSTKRVEPWTVKSIDTMKYSRDIAREKNSDPSFDLTIDTQTRLIAETGANYIAIGTPYDEEFVPFLTRWVKAARKYNLKVWFRGNFSGWEQWFGYKAITSDQHIEMSIAFIKNHPELFTDGDIFSSCPECENGAIGDPRATRKISEYRQFLKNEYNETKAAFIDINKNVSSNYFSMNADVASLIMDQDTTKALGGLVVIDHYVKTSEMLNSDINDLSDKSGGKIVLGEWGAPIPDIHGNLSEEAQSAWINDALSLLSQNKNLQGLNYWTSFGGSTSLWENNGNARQAAQTVKSYFNPTILSGTVRNEIDNPVANATVGTPDYKTLTDYVGKFTLPVYPYENQLEVASGGYSSQTVNITKDQPNLEIKLISDSNNLLLKGAIWLKKLFNRI